ncbi:C10 family peptidase [Emticicia sp. BO119]|uniref:C10 family peptidase n=1 Tax=Emticicia sp. BO119 TaxID=2757768 RepID=UPI0015F07C20|nr:C10 family peptidase [Emticicia sp. BO119]MBA4849380.1 C10 family peptidase [Emticicia sp. BO119]
MKLSFKFPAGYKLVAVLVVFILSLTQCSKDNQLHPDKSTSSKKVETEFKVSLSDAQNLAKHQLMIVEEQNYQRLRRSKTTTNPFKPQNREIQSLRTVKDSEEELYHIINYKEGEGFVIVAADKRASPILAYSDNSSFSDENLPGVKNWFQNAGKHIKLAKSKKEIPAETKKLWEILEGNTAQKKGRTNDQCDEFTTYYETGRYVDALARWWQKGFTSYYSPSDNGCNSDAQCNRKLAGCGPVAMGMVMRYHHFPDNFYVCVNGDCETMDYANMPRFPASNCLYGNNNEKQLALLVRRCGVESSTQYGILGNCNTATYPGSINNAFANLGYLNGGGTWDDLYSNYPQVKSDLQNFFPVIFVGTTGSVNFTDAHIWVGDGYSYLSYQYYVNNCPENQICNDNCVSVLYEYIAMNWGHGGNDNGYYSANYSFIHQGDNYNTYLRALTGIRRN